MDVFGFYLTNHPVTKYKAQYSDIIDANDVDKYFDKVVNVVIYVNRVNTILTKKNTNMSFISGVDDTDEIDIVVFPDQYDLISNISKGNILLVTGRIEKRMSKYQLVLEKVKKL